MASQTDVHAVKEFGSTVNDSDHDPLDESLDNKPTDYSVDTNVQPGVQNIEAVTIAWSKSSLITAYILIWLIYFVQGLVTGISAALVPYLTSSFALHSLTPTTGILASVIGGVTNLSIAKVLDIFGRPQGFMFCIILSVVGLGKCFLSNALVLRLPIYEGNLQVGGLQDFRDSSYISILMNPSHVSWLQQRRNLCSISSFLHRRYQWHWIQSQRFHCRYIVTTQSRSHASFCQFS